jgi:hypothetical protein
VSRWHDVEALLAWAYGCFGFLLTRVPRVRAIDRWSATVRSADGCVRVCAIDRWSGTVCPTRRRLRSCAHARVLVVVRDAPRRYNAMLLAPSFWRLIDDGVVLLFQVTSV